MVLFLRESSLVHCGRDDDLIAARRGAMASSERVTLDNLSNQREKVIVAMAFFFSQQSIILFVLFIICPSLMIRSRR